jgi:hypothetical protein
MDQRIGVGFPFQKQPLGNTDDEHLAILSVFRVEMPIILQRN